MFPRYFQPNGCYIHLWYAIAWWKIIFRRQKDHKLIYRWALIALELGLTIDEKLPKNNFGSDWWCFLGVSNQTDIIFTYNTVLHDGKPFLQKSKRPQTHLLMRFNIIGIRFGCWWKMTIFWVWLVMCLWHFQPNCCYIHL